MNEVHRWVDYLCAIFCYFLYSSRYKYNLLQDTGLCGLEGCTSRDAPECQLGPTAPQFFMGPRFHTRHWKNFHQNYCELDVALKTQVFKNENRFLLIFTETVCENHKPSWNIGCFINVSNRSTYHIHNKKCFLMYQSGFRETGQTILAWGHTFSQKGLQMPIVDMQRWCLYICFAYIRKHILKSFHFLRSSCSVS